MRRVSEYRLRPRITFHNHSTNSLHCKTSMMPDAITLLLPVVLAAHNAEEYAQFDRFVECFQRRLPGRFKSRRIVGVGLILLTLAAAVTAVSTYLFHRPNLLAVIKISTFVLLWNALGHVILSLRHRAVLPGTASALALILPYSAVSIVAMHRDCGDSPGKIAWFAATGAVAGPLIILLALALSYALDRFIDRRGNLGTPSL